MFIGKRRYFTTSTAPRVPATHTEEGTIIRPRRLINSLFIITFIFFALFLLVQFSIFVTKSRLDQPNTIISAVVSGIITLSVVLVVANRLRFGPARIAAQSWPLSLDLPTRLRFHRRAFFGSVGPVRATLYCAEKTISHNADKGKIHQKTIWKAPFPIIEMPEDASSASAEWQICIPRDLPPSFETKANAIEWFFQVEVGDGPFGGAQSTFLLHVQPVCAAS
ncbi:hypothetical protein F8S13_25855 [Chloroflexia bacterium SDU3-3]|nr:hypothetical protein F8S13_25855 [Chloroflexia bacterium SDU3-3]